MRNETLLTAFFALFAFIAMASPAPLFAQAGGTDDTFAAETRPFDFADKFYETNGVLPGMMFNRRNGTDGWSVFDTSADTNYRNVRITATFPAYNSDGSILYWNLYGEFSKDAFLPTTEGIEGRRIAEGFPIFTFPSTTVKNSDRQAAIIRVGDSYFTKNPLGLGIVTLIEYTERIHTRRGQMILAELAWRNGYSLDGTPIIRTAPEVADLTAQGMVTQRVRDVDGLPFAAAKVIQYPERRGIAPDAFLLTVKQQNGEPLPSEQFFETKFECLKGSQDKCP